MQHSQQNDVFMDSLEPHFRGNKNETGQSLVQSNLKEVRSCPNQNIEVTEQSRDNKHANSTFKKGKRAQIGVHAGRKL